MEGRRPLSLHHLTMLDATPRELVDAAIVGGFDYVGLRILDPDTGTEHGDLISDAARRRDLIARAADLPGGVWDVEAVWLRADTDIPALRRALEVARELGARHLLTIGNDPDRGRLLDSLGRLAELAADAGLRIGLEPITYCAVSDVRDARGLLAELARDDVSIVVDSLQFFRSGLELSELATGARPFEYAQIADGDRRTPVGLDALRAEARSDRRVPGSGDFDLTGWVAALPEGIPLAVEAPSQTVRALPRAEAARLLNDAVRAILSSTEGVPA